MAGDAGADGQVGASFFEEFTDFGVDAHEIGQRVKDRGLSADTVRANIGASVDIGTAVDEEASGIKEAIFGGDVKESRATKRE
jgi:hypothetical protein